MTSAAMHLAQFGASRRGFIPSCAHLELRHWVHKKSWAGLSHSIWFIRLDQSVVEREAASCPPTHRKDKTAASQCDV
eukprot:1157652-Pelagomonas_calceolata.AAC.23